MPRERILLLLFGGIGDLLMFTPALDVLAKSFPQVPIDALVRSGAGARVLRDNPALSRIIPYHRNSSNRLQERLKLLRTLRQGHYTRSITICVDFDYKTGLLALLAGAKWRMGPDVRHHGIFYTRKIPMSPQTHYIDRNYALVQLAGADAPLESRKLHFFLNQQEREAAVRFLQEHGISSKEFLVGIHPGCGTWRLERRWPREYYSQLIKRIIRETKARVLLLGGAEEKETLEAIRQEVDSGVISQDPNASLGEYAALVERCSLFIGNDGGAWHLAAAMQTPTISLMGPTDPTWVGHPGKQHLVLQSGLPCSPCLDMYDYASRGCAAQTCMRAITVSQVMQAVQQRLGQEPKN